MLINKNLLWPIALTLSGVMACASSPNSSGQRDLSKARPDSTRSASAYDADDTGKNQRDAGEDLVPTDQARGSDRDVEITRRIRELITSSDNLSVNAQNVKIITLNGLTTLRGPVNSVSERSRIASIARQVAGPKAVRNQLEVAAD
jgi:hyperosmotically inducible protein